MAATYPFDPTGIRPENRITSENQILSPPNYRDYHFIVPNAAPFFRQGLVVRHYPSNQVMVEGVDYILTHYFLEASRSIGKPIYGSISFRNTTLAGTVSIDYQTLGGDWTLDEPEILEILSNTLYNPRIATWSQVVDLPFQFPPINHQFPTDDLVGMSEVITVLEDILEAIQLNGGIVLPTKEQIGLGLVENYGIATQEQAEQGAANNVYMTALRTRQAITYVLSQIQFLQLGTTSTTAYAGSSGVALETEMSEISNLITVINDRLTLLSTGLTITESHLPYRATGSGTGFPNASARLTALPDHSTVVVRTTTGAIRAVNAVNSDELTTLSQVQALINAIEMGETDLTQLQEDIDTVKNNLGALSQALFELTESHNALALSTTNAINALALSTTNSLNTKVDKVAGKQLSTEDYTTGEKSKLGGIQAGATANSTDAQLRDRSSHTGFQAISTITGLQNALNNLQTGINNTETSLDFKVDKVNGKQLSTEDFTTALLQKLNGIQAGATVNSTDAQLRARSSHTGTQSTSTINGLDTMLSNLEAPPVWLWKYGFNQIHTMGSVNGAVALNLDNGCIFKFTANGNINISYSGYYNVGDFQDNAWIFVVDITNGGNFTMNWGSQAHFPDGSPPGLTVNGRDILVFAAFEGGSTGNIALVRAIKNVRAP